MSSYFDGLGIFATWNFCKSMEKPKYHATLAVIVQDASGTSTRIYTAIASNIDDLQQIIIGAYRCESDLDTKAGDRKSIVTAEIEDLQRETQILTFENGRFVAV